MLASGGRLRVFSVAVGLGCRLHTWLGRGSGEREAVPAILPHSAPREGLQLTPQEPGPWGMSVSSCNRPTGWQGMIHRRRTWGVLTHSQQQAKGRPLTARWSFWLTPPGPQPVAGREARKEPSKPSGGGGRPEPRLWGRLQVTISGAVGGQPPRPAVVCGLDRSAYSPGPPERVDGATDAFAALSPSWGASRPSQAPRRFPPLCTFLLQFCLFWNGQCSLPGTPAPHCRVFRGQFGLLQSHPVFHGSLNQPHRE